MPVGAKGDGEEIRGKKIKSLYLNRKMNCHSEERSDEESVSSPSLYTERGTQGVRSDSPPSFPRRRESRG